MKIKDNLKGRVLSGLVWRFGERMSAQLVTFIVSIVLARLLSPNDYGAIALVMVFITIANVFVVFGFGSSLIQKKDADNIDFSSVFYFNIVFSILIYGILYIFAPYIASFYKIDILSPVLRVLGIRIIIAGVNSVQQAYVSRHMLFKRFFWSTLFGTLLSGIVGISMAYMGYGIWALVAQYLTNTTVDTIVLWFTVKWRPDFVFSVSRMKDMFSYGWKLLCSGLLDTGYNQLRSLVIGKMYSASDLAFYDRGKQYPSLIVDNINTSISSVLFPAISQEQDDKSRVKAMTRRAIKTSSYIMWPMMIGLGIVAQPLITLMLTEKWIACVPFLQISCFIYGFMPIHTANLEAIKAVGRSDLFLKLEIIKKIMGISVLLISMKHGVMAIALSGVVTTLISCFINAYPNIKLLNYTYGQQIKDILPSLLLASFMGIIIYPIKFVIQGEFILIAIQVVVGAIIYILCSALLKVDTFMYMLSLIKIRKK